MKLDEARKVLARDAELADRLLAIGTVVGDPSSSLDDLVLGLAHPEVVAEQAALELYRRTGRPMSHTPDQIVFDQSNWIRWLEEHGSARQAR